MLSKDLEKPSKVVASKTTEFHEKLWNGIENNEKLQIKTGGLLYELCRNFLMNTIILLFSKYLMLTVYTPFTCPKNKDGAP